MRDTLPSPPTDRLTDRLCHPCRHERTWALHSLFSDAAFLDRLERRERALARKFGWHPARAADVDLCSAAFIRLSSRLQRGPLWAHPPVDDDAWDRYLNTLTRNVFRTAARRESRRRRREGAYAAEAARLGRATCTVHAATADPSVRAKGRDELHRLECWASSPCANPSLGRQQRAFRCLQLAYAHRATSLREAARFTGTSHTEVRRLLARMREVLEAGDGDCSP